MKEAGVDISQHISKEVGSVMNIPFDHVITVCSQAEKSCPVFPGKTKVIHVEFNDPPRLAEFAQSEDETLSHFRRVRDEIRALYRNVTAIIISKKSRGFNLSATFLRICKTLLPPLRLE